MGPEDKDGLEFEPESDNSSFTLKTEDDHKIVRQSFRVPITDTDGISAQLDGVEFDVLNISTGGVALLLNRPEVFYTDNEIKNLTLKIYGEILRIKVRVAHISPMDSGNYLCGIEFKDMAPETERVVEDYIDEQRRRWLASR